MRVAIRRGSWLLVAVVVLDVALFGRQAGHDAAGSNPAQSDQAVRSVTAKGVAEPIHTGKDGITPPRVIRQIDPEYSDEARKRHIEGVVTLSLVVTSEGKPVQIKVLSGRGYGLDEKAVEAVKHWKFQPGTKDGKPVSTEIAIETNFRLAH